MRRILAAIFSLFVLSACGGSTSDANKTAGPTPPPADVETITVSATPLTPVQTLPGRLTALRSAQVRARVEGVLEKQIFQDGSEVRAGTPLYQIDARLYAANVAAAQGELASARALVERYRPLLESHAVSAQEFDTARARLTSAEAALVRAQIDMDNARPVAPIAGRAGRSLVTEGALVGKAEATHLVTIEQLDPIRVEFTQPYREVAALRKALKSVARKAVDGPEVELLLEDGSVYAHRGRLTFTDLAVDPASGAVTLRAQFPNPERELLPGAFVEVRLAQDTQTGVLRVPQRAVATTAQGQSVLLVGKDNTVQSRSVVSSGQIAGDFLISSGLAVGDQVIVSGMQKIRPGANVKPRPWSSARAAGK